MQKRRRCYYCHSLYYPNPRCHKPKACSNPKCQKMRKYDSHKIWRESDPEIMSDRRTATRKWLKKHPKYLKAYRKKHLDYVEQNRRKQREKAGKKKSVDISTLISPQIPEKQRDIFKLVPLDSSVDISIPIFVQRINLYKESVHLPTC